MIYFFDEGDTAYRLTETALYIVNLKPISSERLLIVARYCWPRLPTIYRYRQSSGIATRLISVGQRACASSLADYSEASYCSSHRPFCSLMKELAEIDAKRDSSSYRADSLVDSRRSAN